MDRMRAELSPCGRIIACAPFAPSVLLVGGRIGSEETSFNGKMPRGSIKFMLLASLSIPFGAALLVQIAYWFVEGSTSTARHFGMPPLNRLSY